MTDPAPGWYDDPTAPGSQRYWDGKAWTSHAAAPVRPPERLGDSAGMRMLLPVGRSPLAIVAGYLGLVSVLCVPAPFALGFGIAAAVDLKRHPEKHGWGRAIFGIVMGGLFTLLAIVMFVAG